MTTSTRSAQVSGCLQVLGCLALTLALGACSSVSAGLSTGSLLGPPSAPKPKTPVELASDRAFRAGAITAKAKRCGYVFDPAAVRQSYLAFEAGPGGAPEHVALAEKKYDYTVQSLGGALAGNAAFCSSDEETAAIKRDLGKSLAGDFSLPAARLDVSPFSSSAAPMDRDAIFNPRR